MPVPLRADFDAVVVRALAKKSRDGAQARRLLAVAAIYDGASRTEAAKIAWVTLQIIRDWVVKFNASGPHTRLREVALKAGVSLSALEIWFCDEARIGQKNKIARRGHPRLLLLRLKQAHRPAVAHHIHWHA